MLLHVCQLSEMLTCATTIRGLRDTQKRASRGGVEMTRDDAVPYPGIHRGTEVAHHNRGTDHDDNMESRHEGV